MIDVTDRHCRYFHRLLAPRGCTEMITTGALLHGNVARHLDFDEAEHPVALQLAAASRTRWRNAPGWADNGATTKST